MSRRLMILLCLCVACLFKDVQSAVLGIDMGSDRIKVSVVQPGRAFEIVLDEASKRSHPSLVVFDDDVRQYGTTGSSLVSRRPDKSFLQFTRYLGKPYNTSMADELKKNFIFNEVIKDDKRGTVRFKSPYVDANANISPDDLITSTSYSVEEITAMKLKHIKQIAEDFTQGDVSDVVFTVPHFWSSKERQALRDAAQLAGLNVYGLVNENSAAAIQYGLKRDFSSNKTEYYIFYNMGSTATQVSVTKYWAYDVKERSKTRTVGCVDVISQAYDETLGGDSFDQIVAEYIIDQAKELLRKQTNPKIDESIINNLQNDARFTARIRTAANKAKKILSANKEASINIEGVYQDIDYRGMISRDLLYQEAEKALLFERALAPLNEAMENLNGKIDKSDIEGIVLLGGSTRIPKIKELLGEYLSKELKMDLNADEAPALGAAFRAANLSSTFRVLGVNFEDTTLFPIGVRLSNLADQNDQESSASDSSDGDDEKFAKRGSLFNKNNNLYKRRAVTLKHNEDLFVSLFYEKYAKLPMDTSTDLGSFEITGIKEAVAKYRAPDYNISDSSEDYPKVSLSFLLDADGIVDLVQATATFTEYVTEERKVPKKSTESAESSDATKDAEGAEKTAEGGAAEGSEATEGTEGTEASEGDAKEGDDAAAAAEAEMETEVTTRKKTHRVDLKVKKMPPSDVRAYDADDFDLSFKALMELDDRDQSRLATAAARNELESYIFESRSKLYEDDNVQKVSTEEERESLMTLLGEAEDWIWEVEEETQAIFSSKTKELKKVGDVIFFRAKELEARPKAVDAAGKLLGQLFEYVETLRVNYTWVNATETDRLETMAKNAEQWLNDKIEAQAKLTLQEEPAFESVQVKRRLVPILEYAQKLLSRQKPYDYYKKDRKSKNGTKSANGTNTTNGTSETNEDVEVPIDTNDDGEETKTEETIDEDDEQKGEL